VEYDFDLIVIGSGPAGQRAAIQAAKLGKRVAIVEKEQVGGVSVNWGTIPSKTLREAIIYLTGLSQRSTYGESYRVKEEITIEDLRRRTQHVIDREVDVVRNQLMRNHVHLFEGTAFTGEFLKQRATKELFALEQHIPAKVIDRDSTRGWLQSGGLDTWARAKERTAALLEAYERPAIDPALEAELRGLVEAIAKDAGIDALPEVVV
jgi:flavin-dependent dehydrogenase